MRKNVNSFEKLYEVSTIKSIATIKNIKQKCIKGRFHDIFLIENFASECNFCSAQYSRSSTFHDKKCVLYLHLLFWFWKMHK